MQAAGGGRSGELAEAGRLQAEGEEERALSMVVGCMAGKDKRLVVEEAAESSARTHLCLASCSARTGRAERTAVVAGGCERSR